MTFCSSNIPEVLGRASEEGSRDSVPGLPEQSKARILAALSNLTEGLRVLGIVGPTATGKSDWGIALARALNGEVISVDSRQIYRGLDLGTGKIEGTIDASRARTVEALGSRFELAPFMSRVSCSQEGSVAATDPSEREVEHWLIDIAPPAQVVTAAQIQILAYDAIREVASRNRIPLLVGGTGLYTHSIVNGLVMPEVAPDNVLRAELEQWTVEALREELLRLDPEAGAEVDLFNPRRMIRAIEVVRAVGKLRSARGKVDVPFRTLLLGIRTERKQLLTRIHDRLMKRVNAGLIEEVEDLARAGLSHERMEDLGLEYRYISRYVRGLTTRSTMLCELERAIARFARRQSTWYQSHGPVFWVDTVEEAMSRATAWLDDTVTFERSPMVKS